MTYDVIKYHLFRNPEVAGPYKWRWYAALVALVIELGDPWCHCVVQETK